MTLSSPLGINYVQRGVKRSQGEADKRERLPIKPPLLQKIRMSGIIEPRIDPLILHFKILPFSVS